MAQDGIAAILARLAHLEDGGAVINWRAEAVDARDRGDDDRVATLEERLGGCVPELINLIIAA